MTDTNKHDVGLLWFTNDLRIEDNQTLVSAAESCHKLICVYVVEQTWFKSNRYGLKSISEKRWQFLYESLIDLNVSLERLNQSLLIVFDDPVVAVSKLIKEYGVSALFKSELPGVYENLQLNHVKQKFPKLSLYQYPALTLFSKSTLPISLDAFREIKSFSYFRRKVEPLESVSSFKTPLVLPPVPGNSKWSLPKLPELKNVATETAFVGGADSGKRQLLKYFSSQNPTEYKQVRNELDGWNNSTKFSPWLANGSISVWQIVRLLKQFEREVTENESTYWISFELLWREYFHWLSKVHTSKFFHRNGIRDTNILTSYYPERFKRWCEGNTPYPLVNACMKQLNQTGYMSNRGRQIVASCLVNELSVDWRYGAAYFEQQLIDYDVAVNWGNWQYLAGVGSDPRGKRHFDLDKQTEIYDPERIFIKKWKAEQHEPTLDAVDAADWPIAK